MFLCFDDTQLLYFFQVPSRSSHCVIINISCNICEYENKQGVASQKQNAKECYNKAKNKMARRPC